MNIDEYRLQLPRSGAAAETKLALAAGGLLTSSGHPAKWQGHLRGRWASKKSTHELPESLFSHHFWNQGVSRLLERRMT